MPLGLTELTLMTLFAGIFVLLMMTCLIHFHVSLQNGGKNSLRLGAMAIAVDFLATLILSLPLILTPHESGLATPWLLTEWLLTEWLLTEWLLTEWLSTGFLSTTPWLLAGILLKQFASMCWVCVMWQLMKKRVSRPLWLVPLFSLLLASVLMFSAMAVEFVILLMTVPLCLLLLVSAVLLLREGALVPSLAMTGLIICHMLLSLLLPFTLENSSVFVFVIFLDLAVMLMTSVTLMMFAAAWSVSALSERDETVVRFAQHTRRLELQYSQSQKHESLGVLAGGIAHDFNNMLTSILGYTSLAMRNLEADSPVRKDLYMVMSGARQAVDLTSQMLAYAGKGAIEFQSVDVSRIVENMAGLINSVVPGDFHLTQKLGTGLPMVRGDAVQLGQVVMNLVANAVDAIDAPSGAVEIRTGLSDVDTRLMATAFFAETQEPGAFIFIEVSDTGVGMSPDQLEKIFDPFYSDKNQSRGLGLSSLAGIVRQHKGFVCVTSAEGVGSTLTVYLPIVTYHDGEGLHPKIAPGSGAVGVKFKGRILVADDDKRIRSLISSVLGDDLYSIDEVGDGREAVNRLETHGSQYDLIILDCTMPKLSGSDVYKQIRASGITVPVLLISGYRQEQVLSDIDRDPAAFFLKKPFGVDELVEQVGNVFRETQSDII